MTLKTSNLTNSKSNKQYTLYSTLVNASIASNYSYLRAHYIKYKYFKGHGKHVQIVRLDRIGYIK